MGVYSDIFIYIDLDHFGGFKIMNFNTFGVFRKMNIFGGMMKLWIFFFFFFFWGGGGGGHHKWGYFYKLRLFLRSRCRIGILGGGGLLTF